MSAKTHYFVQPFTIQGDWVVPFGGGQAPTAKMAVEAAERIWSEQYADCAVAYACEVDGKAVISHPRILAAFGDGGGRQLAPHGEVLLTH